MQRARMTPPRHPRHPGYPRHGPVSRSGRATGGLLLGAALALLLSAPFSAVGEERDRGETALESKPSLDLDSLLRPRGLGLPKEGVGGHDREHWRDRFTGARVEIATLEVSISDTHEKIRQTVNSDLQYTPTGGGAPSDPDVLRLQAELKRDRRSLETAERRLRELEVEASLAGVPRDWTQPEPR